MKDTNKKNIFLYWNYSKNNGETDFNKQLFDLIYHVLIIMYDLVSLILFYSKKNLQISCFF